MLGQKCLDGPHNDERVSNFHIEMSSLWVSDKLKHKVPTGLNVGVADWALAWGMSGCAGEGWGLSRWFTGLADQVLLEQVAAPGQGRNLCRHPIPNRRECGKAERRDWTGHGHSRLTSSCQHCRHRWVGQSLGCCGGSEHGVGHKDACLGTYSVASGCSRKADHRSHDPIHCRIWGCCGEPLLLLSLQIRHLICRLLSRGCLRCGHLGVDVDP